MQWILVVVAILWVVLGNPKKDLASWFWSESAAPWEQVDAVYYPDRSDLSEYEIRRDVGGLDACRDWAYFRAENNDDGNFQRGDYECGIGKLDAWEGMTVYRITVR